MGIIASMLKGSGNSKVIIKGNAITVSLVDDGREATIALEVKINDEDALRKNFTDDTIATLSSGKFERIPSATDPIVKLIISTLEKKKLAEVDSPANITMATIKKGDYSHIDIELGGKVKGNSPEGKPSVSVELQEQADETPFVDFAELVSKSFSDRGYSVLSVEDYPMQDAVILTLKDPSINGVNTGGKSGNSKLSKGELFKFAKANCKKFGLQVVKTDSSENSASVIVKA